jgi:hypothetical protein
MQIQSSTLRSKLVRINSANRKKDPVYGYTSSNFRLDFNINIPDLVKVHSIVLKSCSIPNTQYNIDFHNNTFSFLAGLDETSINVPPGNYTIDELIDELVTSGVGEFYGLTISVAFPSGKLQFGFNTPCSLLNYEQGNDMAMTLGLMVNSGPITNYTADSLPNLTGVQNIYIVSQTLSGGTGMIDSTLNQLAVFGCIQITVPFGQYTHYVSAEEQSDEVFFPSDRTIGEVDLSLYNDRGQNIDLQGLDWSMIVKIYYHVTSQE